MLRATSLFWCDINKIEIELFANILNLYITDLWPHHALGGGTSQREDS